MQNAPHRNKCTCITRTHSSLPHAMSSSNTSALSTTAASPLECLPTADLTPSGLLLLDSSDGEVELLQRHGDLLQLRSESVEPLSAHSQYKDRINLSAVVLTTHRLVFTSTLSNKEKRFLHLSNIHAAEPIATSVFSSHCKTRLSTYSLGELILVLPKKEPIFPILQKTLERRAWETASRLEQQQRLLTTASSSSSKRRVGVDAIMASTQRKHDRAAKLTDQAFTGDAETLLREATELVAIIHKYAATLQQSSSCPKQDNDDTTTTTTTDTTAPLADMLQDMGMTSALPVSSSEKSTVYYETLARQLADFLRPKLANNNTTPLMTLTDVYCLYNRARGTNLISPQDLLSAVEKMDSLPELQLQLQTFPSGLKVIQSSQFNPDEMGIKLQQMCVAHNSALTAMDVSRELKMSAVLAKEALVAAERKGYLCRDVTLESTRFYKNQFPEFALKW